MNSVFLAFVAHELDEPSHYVAEIARILKPNGRLIIIEYAKALSWGTPLNHRLASEDMDRWASDAGFYKSSAWQWSGSIVGWEYTKSTEK